MDRGDGGKDGDRSKGEGYHAEETKKRKKVKRIEDFNNEDVVWAKMKGYSFWPAQITLQVLGMFKKGSGTKTMYHVTFLGGDWAPKWIPQSFIRKFEPEDTGPNRKKDYRSCVKWEASHLAAMKIGLEKLLQTELVAAKKPETPKVAFTVCQYFVRGICERRFCKFLHEKPSPVPEKKEELTPYPAKRPEPTSVKKPEPTPVKKPEPTPVKKPEPTPVNKPEPSPVKKPEPSPVKKPQPTPAKGKQEDRNGIRHLGGSGNSWDRNEDWDVPSDNQRDRVKRLEACSPRSEISLEDLEMCDVDEDQELFDKTGKKLTFCFPDVLSAAVSQGSGRVKKINTERAGGIMMSEKTEDRGEKEKRIKPMERSKRHEDGDLFHCIANECNRLFSLEEIINGEAGHHVLENHGMLPWQVRQNESKFLRVEPQKEVYDGDNEQKEEKEKKLLEEVDKMEPKGEKEKNPMKNVKPEEDESDLYEDNIEDMKVVHEFPFKRGGPPPQQKCQYEIIRDNNIADREALMRVVLADIRKTSKEIVEENEKRKKRKLIDQGKANKEKKKKIEKVVDVGEVRRSARERRPVSYCVSEDDDDPDWKPDGRKKKVEKKRKRDCSNDYIKDRKPLPPGWNPKWNHIHNPFEKKKSNNGGESSSKDKNDEKDTDSAESGRRSMRERKYINYNFDGPRADEFVFCERCGQDKYHGCELHPLIFDYVANFDVGPSKVAKNAGRGVFNNDSRGDIPTDVMFGPYDGTFYTPKEYALLKKSRGESGYAWELRDPDKIQVIGFVDPGLNPNPLTNWMSIVNCASKTRNQNLMPGQFIGGIYYKSMEKIHFGEELLVYYGNDYARDIKIKVEERDFYDLDEDWEEEGVSCPHCGDGFVKAEYLQKHIDNVDSTRAGGCKVLRKEKNRADVLAGIKPHVCGECGWGFKTRGDLTKHKPTHSDAMPFVCPECDKAYKFSPALHRHVKAEHEGQRFDCPDCERPFKSKCSMMRHWKNVCNREDKEYKCNQCGKKFNLNGNLIKHIKEVHNREVPHKCELCGKRFSKKSSLKEHINGVHLKARPHACPDCDATFQTAHKLDHHRIRTHTKQWYWNCEVCDKKRIEKGFLLPKDLKKHMLVHHPVEYKEQIEREKPAVCPKCQKRFPSEEQVRIHLKKIHNEYN